MDKILYIHVGTPKTGTSAIQQFCAINTEAFEKRGYCYPMIPYKYKRTLRNRNGHFLAGPVRDENGNRNAEEERRRFLGGMEIVRELFQSYDAVVLSDEALWRATTYWIPGLWDELKQMGREIGFKVVIIVYLRRQDEYLTSLWSQDLKAGYFRFSDKTWKEWYEGKAGDRVIDYKIKMEEYISAVGKENVVIRKYDREGFIGGNIYSDFLQAIDLEIEEDFIVPEQEKNQGLKGNTNEIRRIINTIPGISDKDHAFFRDMTLKISGISARNYPCTEMSRKEKEELLAQYAEGNREVARLIYGDDRELFELNDKELPKWEKDNPYFIDDVIRLIAVTTLQLRAENRELKEAVKKLENNSRNYAVNYPKKLAQKMKRIVEKKEM